jgi:hypothetical protein
LPKPLKFNTTIYNQYAFCHNIEDLECVKEIIITKYNVPEKLVNYVFNEQTFMFCNNIFIMKKEYFYDYCNFIFNVLNDYLNLNKLNNIQDVFQFISTNEKKYLKNYYPNNEIKYQSRIGGAISERLLNVYVLWKNLDINISSLIITEDKYNNINEKDFL